MPFRAQESPNRCDPPNEVGTLLITDHAVGAVLSMGMFIMVWSALPVVRPFLIAAAGLGAVYGSVLWVRRR